MANISRRGFMAGAVGALGLPFVAGCSGPVAAGLFGGNLSPQTLVYWNLFGGGDGVRMQAMEAGYRKIYGPDSLQATTFAWGNPYYTKVTLATVGNQPPDVAVAHLTRAKPLWEGGLLDPITAEDLASVGLSADDFSKRPWQTQITDGENIAIPLDTHPIVTFFNTEVCQKAGLADSEGKLTSLDGMDTFEDALAELAKVVDGPVMTVANSGGETATPWRMFWSLYNQIEGATPFLSNDGADLTVDKDAFVAVNQKIQEWVKKGWLNKSLDYATAQSYMFTGRSAFYFQGEWELTTAESIEGLKFGMVPIPTIFDKAACQADSHTFILPRKDRSPEKRAQAMKFLKAMLDQSLTWAKGGHIPAYRPVLDSPEYAKLEPQADYASAADSAVYDDAAWYGGSGSTFEGRVGAQLGLVQQMQLSPEQALTNISDQLQVYLNTPSPL